MSFALFVAFLAVFAVKLRWKMSGFPAPTDVAEVV